MTTPKADEYSLSQLSGCKVRVGIGISSISRGQRAARAMQLYIGQDVLEKMGVVKGDSVDALVSPSSGECRLVKTLGGRMIHTVGKRGRTGIITFTIKPGTPYTDGVEECEMLSVTKDEARFRLPKNVKWGK